MTYHLKRWAAVSFLTLAYGFAIVVARITGTPRAVSDARKTGRILVIGTFHNPNWFYAHLEPLARCSNSQIILVADGYTGEVEGLKVIVPNRIVSKLLSRAGAKLLWSVWCAIKYRPDHYMGYAIFPAATTALILGRIFRRPSCFQVTSGPLELAGGGFHAENKILSSLGKPSRWIEKLAFSLTSQFDLLIVRGHKAKDFIRGFGATNRIETITGSVEMPADCPHSPARRVDLIFVGRLTKRKRPDRFVDVVARVARTLPEVRCLIVGDGPEEEAVRQQIEDNGLNDQITMLGLRDDVLELQGQSKIFVLTSRWEGVSIAMLEAMSSGTIPVVSDVGDLRDVVDQGKNGFVLDENDVDGFSVRILELLQDEERLLQLSLAARQTVYDRCSREAIARKWHETLKSMDIIA